MFQSVAGTGLLLLGFAGGVIAQVRPNPPNPVAVEGGGVLPTNPSTALFFDNFEYAVPRTTDVVSAFRAHGWSGAKSGRVPVGGAAGYLYTQADATLGSNVLVMESLPSQNIIPGWGYGQTDYYLQLGQENGAVYLPPNVWFQFWTYSTPQSRFANRDKVLYPCRTYFPCSSDQASWLFMWGRQGFEYVGSDADLLPVQNRMLSLQGFTADNRNTPEYPDGNTGLYQNVNKASLLAGRWYQVKMHMDISGAQGVWEAWIRERGQTAWTKVADWRGGVTPNFTWPIPTAQRTGHAMLRTPTTVNGVYGDSTTYMDDFTIGRSEAELPNQGR